MINLLSKFIVGPMCVVLDATNPSAAKTRQPVNLTCAPTSRHRTMNDDYSGTPRISFSVHLWACSPVPRGHLWHTTPLLINRLPCHTEEEPV